MPRIHEVSSMINGIQGAELIPVEPVRAENDVNDAS
jgi:hypothetical protein